MRCCQGGGGGGGRRRGGGAPRGATCRRRRRRRRRLPPAPPRLLKLGALSALVAQRAPPPPSTCSRRWHPPLPPRAARRRWRRRRPCGARIQRLELSLWEARGHGCAAATAGGRCCTLGSPASSAGCCGGSRAHCPPRAAGGGGGGRRVARAQFVGLQIDTHLAAAAFRTVISADAPPASAYVARVLGSGLGARTHDERAAQQLRLSIVVAHPPTPTPAYVQLLHAELRPLALAVEDALLSRLATLAAAITSCAAAAAARHHPLSSPPSASASASPSPSPSPSCLADDRAAPAADAAAANRAAATAAAAAASLHRAAQPQRARRHAHRARLALGAPPRGAPRARRLRASRLPRPPRLGGGARVRAHRPVRRRGARSLAGARRVAPAPRQPDAPPSLAAGLGDAVQLPLRGAQHGPAGFVAGLAAGASSLVLHTSRRPHLRRRLLLRRRSQPRRAPRAAADAPPPAFALGHGLLGVVTRPVGGALGLVSAATTPSSPRWAPRRRRRCVRRSGRAARRVSATQLERMLPLPHSHRCHANASPVAALCDTLHLLVLVVHALRPRRRRRADGGAAPRRPAPPARAPRGDAAAGGSRGVLSVFLCPPEAVSASPRASCTRWTPTSRSSSSPSTSKSASSSPAADAPRASNVLCVCVSQACK